jgi:glycosyltransferase involved in cell wall biosynthesis
VAEPLVSVVIPVRDGASFVSDAIDSVLAQTYRPLEIIVVDDGSTDDTGDVLARFGDAVRAIRQTPAGAAVARNRGVREARGDYIAFLDADDLWVPDKLQMQMAVLTASPEVDGVFGAMAQTGQPGIAPDVGPTVTYSVSVALLRRSAFERVGPLSEHWRVGEFVDWCARAEDAGLRFVMLPDLLAYRRVHGANTGIRRRDARGDYLHIVRARLERARRADGAQASGEREDTP